MPHPRQQVNYDWTQTGIIYDDSNYGRGVKVLMFKDGDGSIEYYEKVQFDTFASDVFDPLLNMTKADADVKRKEWPGHGWFQFRTDIIPFKTEEINIEYNDEPKHNIIRIKFKDSQRSPLTLRVPKKGLNLTEKPPPPGQPDLDNPIHHEWYKEKVYKSMSWWREFFTGDREGGVKNTGLMRVWAADAASFGRFVRAALREDEAASGGAQGGGSRKRSKKRKTKKRKTKKRKSKKKHKRSKRRTKKR